jgi:eukaryotic-like serine/threonine-protein kinase
VEASLKSDAQTQLDTQLGRVLAGRYRLEAPLGEGGIGRVYAGTHLKLGRRVAIKVLHEAYRDNEALQRRFEREAMALSAISHPHVVTVIDYGTEDELAYIVMEIVEGRDLAQILTEGPLPPVRAMSLMRQLLRSLVYAHQNGLIHRDLKPANIMVRRLPDGAEHVHVLDFGLAKFLAEETNDQLTRSGHVLGTPAYMSPEQ